MLTAVQNHRNALGLVLSSSKKKTTIGCDSLSVLHLNVLVAAESQGHIISYEDEESDSKPYATVSIPLMEVVAIYHHTIRVQADAPKSKTKKAKKSTKGFSLDELDDRKAKTVAPKATAGASAEERERLLVIAALELTELERGIRDGSVQCPTEMNSAKYVWCSVLCVHWDRQCSVLGFMAFLCATPLHSWRC